MHSGKPGGSSGAGGGVSLGFAFKTQMLPVKLGVERISLFLVLFNPDVKYESAAYRSNPLCQSEN